MIIGADYYPEHWPEDRLEIDLELMQNAGFNVIRIAEFAWDKMEPSEGNYDFLWLDRILDKIQSYGIKAVLCTPTATPPKWLINKHPEILQTDSQGIVRGFGSRKHYCASSKIYKVYSERIAKVMAERYGDHPAVMAWQVDNEFGCHDHVCYCDDCKEGFQQWLEAKYGNIQNLNQSWGTYFWSQTYSSFDDVIVPSYTQCDGKSNIPSQYTHNPGLLLDYQRYQSDAMVDYQKLQLNILKKNSNYPITHNLMGHFGGLDYHDLGKDLDFICWDNYVTLQWNHAEPSEIGMGHEIMRGIKDQNYWVMEQQSGPCGWNYMGRTPKPGQLALWAHQAVAHGAEAIVFFRWRACTVGIEQYWHGILDHDGVPRRRYEELKAFAAEMAELDDYVTASPESEVAIIKSYDNLWSHEVQPHANGFSYDRLLQDYYKAFFSNSLPSHVMGMDADLSTYKLVVLPAFNLMTGAYKEKLENYVKNGGNLVITFRSGTREWDNAMTPQAMPGYFADLAGIEVTEFDAIGGQEEISVSGFFGQGTSSLWCDIIEPKTAESLAEYKSDYYAGKSAITLNQFGQGKVYYIGCDLDQESMTDMIGKIAGNLGLTPITSPNKSLEATIKSSENHRYVALLNHSGSETTAILSEDLYRAIGDDPISLSPYQTRIIRIK